jgi:uncharacterized protein YacL (UPF0231 family)
MMRKKADSTENKLKSSKSQTRAKTKKTKAKTKSTKKSTQPLDDAAIIIVDDDLEIDKEKEIEERRAYLEEARSQEALD